MSESAKCKRVDGRMDRVPSIHSSDDERRCENSSLPKEILLPLTQVESIRDLRDARRIWFPVFRCLPCKSHLRHPCHTALSRACSRTSFVKDGACRLCTRNRSLLPIPSQYCVRRGPLIHVPRTRLADRVRGSSESGLGMPRSRGLVNQGDDRLVATILGVNWAP
jgi:hypothetical protein